MRERRDMFGMQQAMLCHTAYVTKNRPTHFQIFGFEAWQGGGPNPPAPGQALAQAARHGFGVHRTPGEIHQQLCLHWPQRPEALRDYLGDGFGYFICSTLTWE